jgi:hypothetical protein
MARTRTPYSLLRALSPHPLHTVYDLLQPCPPPILASGALQFAFEKATLEGKITIGALLILSLFSWTIIITKIRQLFIATESGPNASSPPTPPRAIRWTSAAEDRLRRRPGL